MQLEARRTLMNLCMIRAGRRWWAHAMRERMRAERKRWSRRARVGESSMAQGPRPNDALSTQDGDDAILYSSRTWRDSRDDHDDEQQQDQTSVCRLSLRLRRIFVSLPGESWRVTGSWDSSGRELASERARSVARCVANCSPRCVCCGD